MAVRSFLHTISLTLVLGAPATAESLPPATASSQNVRATLSSETSAFIPGQPFWAGLRLQMQPGWHVYWKQPGDSGLPPRVKWSLPAGWAADDLVFPYPQRFTEGSLATYGYAGDVMLLAQFTLTDTNGKAHALSSYRGQHVVLEWVNFGCPFVGKHYGSGNMQKLQKTYMDKGVVWLAVNSSAEGKQGYHTAAEVNALLKEKASAPTAYLIDTDGKVGHLYAARTTPHMYVIDPQGTLVYAGGIDDKPTTDLADIAGATNYVQAALDETLAGKPVTTAVTKPYGCSVKYAAE